MMMISLVNAAGREEEDLIKLQNFAVNNDNNKLMIAKEKEFTTVLSAMEEHPKNATVQEYGCSILGNLAVNYNNKAKIAANQGITIILSAMKNLILNDTVQYSMLAQHIGNWL